MTLLSRSGRRYLFRHPWQIGLSTLGVAIAVAVVVGIDVANASAERAFLLSVEGVAGRATHEIAAGARGVDEAVYRRLRVDAGFRRLAPVAEGYVTSDRLPSRPLRLFGVDPFAEALFRGFTRTLHSGPRSGDLGRFLTEPGAVLAGAELAAELGLDVGDTFEVRFAGRRHRLVLIGLLEPGDDLGRSASRDLLVADVASAQEILDQVGRLSRVEVVVDGAAEEAGLRSQLPAGVELRSKAARSGALDEMTRAFRLNLQALSLLALLVGMFLIYNTVTFSVVQRRPLIGTLRALGVTRREIFLLVLSETAVLAVVGSAAGLALGTVLSRTLVELMVQTINDLYFVTSVQGVEISPLAWGKGALLGIGGTLAAALIPAREANEEPPRAVLERSHLERRTRRSLPRWTATGLVLLAVAGALIAIPSKSLPLSFAAVFVFVLGCAGLVPAATLAGARLLEPLAAKAFGILGAMAARSVAATLSRTGVAVAALVIAVAMTIGVSIMVRSFRATLIDWLQVTLQADYYVAPADLATRGQGRRLDPRLVAALRRTPGVAYVTTYLRLEAGTEHGPTRLSVLDVEQPAFRVFPWATGEREDVWRQFVDGAVIVSEPYAYHHDLEIGDRVELHTGSGRRSFEIAGVFYDYASDRGIVAIHRRTYDRWWDDPTVQSMGIFAAPGSDAEALSEALHETVARAASDGGQEIRIAANRDLRRGALAIFDRTFRITDVLRLLAVGVAFIGILSALMALQLERARELGVLRAIGLTPGQVWGLVTAQTGLTGLISGLLAAPLGVALSVLLIEIINRRSFGWTLRMDLTPGILAQAILLALAAALLAGLYPAYRMSRSSPALALREE
ncbi:MAG: FtsX-like permease family protein [Thermoanaerobaculia bacterium]